MKWIKMSEKLPEFNQIVLLCEKDDMKNIVSTGKLKSITAEGNIFEIQTMDDIFSMFGGSKLKLNNWTHWTEITIPE
jgi:hypothetical protein